MLAQYHPTTFDITETERCYILAFEMPEYMGKNIEVSLEKGDLVLKGRNNPYRASDSEDARPSVTLRISEPSQCIAARYQDGRILIALPKSACQEQSSKNNQDGESERRLDWVEAAAAVV